MVIRTLASCFHTISVLVYFLFNRSLTETNHWKLENSQMPRRRGHSCVVYNNAAYLFGGFGTRGFVDTLIEYSFRIISSIVCDFLAYVTESNTFSELTFTAQSDDSCPPRSFHLGVLYDKRMYVFAGVGTYMRLYL